MEKGNYRTWATLAAVLAVLWVGVAVWFSKGNSATQPDVVLWGDQRFRSDPGFGPGVVEMVPLGTPRETERAEGWFSAPQLIHADIDPDADPEGLRRFFEDGGVRFEPGDSIEFFE